jgi:hypothetical protein
VRYTANWKGFHDVWRPQQNRNCDPGHSDVTGYNPDSWLDILGLLILAAAFVGAAALPAWFSHRKQNRTLNTIRDQVQNEHGTNLRDDLDGVKEDISDLKEIVLQGFQQINESLNIERRERIAGDNRIKGELKRH